MCGQCPVAFSRCSVLCGSEWCRYAPTSAGAIESSLHCMMSDGTRTFARSARLSAKKVVSAKAPARSAVKPKPAAHKATKPAAAKKTAPALPAKAAAPAKVVPAPAKAAVPQKGAGKPGAPVDPLAL